MKLVVPMAGSQDLQEKTFSVPKSIIEIAGKPLITHLVHKLQDLNIEKAVFIVDKDRPKLRRHLEREFSFEVIFIKQVEKKGPGHAVLGAKKHVQDDDDVIILFADTLVEFDKKHVTQCKARGVIFTKKVDNPTQYGVVFVNDAKVTRLIEKPDIPSSDKAIVGMYYFKKAKDVFNALEHIVKHDIKTKGDFQVTDAIQVMVNNDVEIHARQVKYWNNCDTSQNLLLANQHLLRAKSRKKTTTLETNVIIPPVYVHHTSEIINSVIGPNVTVNKESTIIESRVKNSIIGRGSTIEGSVLSESVIGRFADIKTKSNKLTIGDYSEIEYS